MKMFSCLKNPVEILPIISVYALSCNIFFFFLAFFENCDILSLKIQWERVKNATMFSFFFSVKTAVSDWMSRCSLPDERGWVVLPALERAQKSLCPRLLQFGILLMSLSLPRSCRGIGMILEAKPSPPFSQALLFWGSPAEAVRRMSASPMLNLSFKELLSELWSPSPGLMGYIPKDAALGMSCCLSQWTLSGGGSVGAQ